MNRDQIAEALEEIGLLLDIKGANAFKVRAYTNGARALQSAELDDATLADPKELSKLKGVGKALSEKIATLATTGQLPYLDNLRSEIPGDLLDWLRIPGLGPKKVKAIHNTLEISTLGELAQACEENRLVDLEGFGSKSQEKILRGIDHIRSHSGRFLQPLIQGEAARLLELVSSHPTVIRAEVGGSVRRAGETSKDIDIVATCHDDNTVPLMDAFVAADGVQEVIARGSTKCSVRLDTGPAVDLRVVEDGSFAPALQYFTGSKAHNIAVRSRAQKMGYKLNEYALTREQDGVEMDCPDEHAIYKTLGLTWIPPELREDSGEIAAAERGELPVLIEEGDIQGALHCHSEWSDGRASIREMAAAAQKLGHSYIAICDHSRGAPYAGGLSIEQVAEQHGEIEALNEELGGSFRILKGIEVDILPDGELDYPDEVLATFDLVIAAVHRRFTLTEQEQTERFLKAIQNPHTHLLAHLTGRLLLSREPYPLDVRAVIDAAAEAGVAIECNASAQRLDLDWRNLKYGKSKGLKTAICPDAHSTEGLKHITSGVRTARKGWCAKEDVLNTKSADELLAYLGSCRS